MALPALHALARLGRLTIAAPPWGADLYRDVPARVVAPHAWREGDAAVLFPPSFRAAWEARRVPRRVGVAADHRGWLLTDVVAPGPHRRDTYAALAAALGAVAEGVPAFRARPADPDADVPLDHVGLVPVSPSGAVVSWRGFADLARRLDRPVVFYGGPGEGPRVAAIAGSFPLRVGLPLPAFARALDRCAVLVGNDSGAAHFARACGIPTVVVHGSTTAARTGPHGALAVEGSAPCRPCYRKRCPWDLECLDVSVDRVLDAVQAALGAAA
jgi:heptosyltransferase-2/heptosyltransferase-3